MAKTTTDPSYPDVCIPPHPSDQDCPKVAYKDFRVLPPVSRKPPSPATSVLSPEPSLYYGNVAVPDTLVDASPNKSFGVFPGGGGATNISLPLGSPFTDA